jgi:DNA-binding transcriptional MerR regulator
MRAAKRSRRTRPRGFTLVQIRGVLGVGDSDEPSCEHVAQLIDARSRDVEKRIGELQATQSTCVRWRSVLLPRIQQPAAVTIRSLPGLLDLAPHGRDARLTG